MAKNRQTLTMEERDKLIPPGMTGADNELSYANFQRRQDLVARTMKFNEKNMSPAQKKMLVHLGMYGLDPPDPTDAKAVQERIEEYFRVCIETETAPNVDAIRVLLGIKPLKWYEIRRGNGGLTPEIMDAVHSAIDVICSYYQSAALDRQKDTVAAIFLLKSQFGFSDQPQQIAVQDRQYTDAQVTQLLKEASEIQVIDADFKEIEA